MGLGSMESLELKADQPGECVAEKFFCLFIYFNLILFFCLFRAAPTTYGGSQARDPIGAVAASLHHSHSNDRSEPHL